MPAFGVREEEPGHCSICLVENLAPQTPHHCVSEANKNHGSQFLNVSQLQQLFHFCSFLFINTFPTSSCCTEWEEPKLGILDSSQLQTSFKFSQVCPQLRLLQKNSTGIGPSSFSFSQISRWFPHLPKLTSPIDFPEQNISNTCWHKFPHRNQSVNQQELRQRHFSWPTYSRTLTWS